METNLGFVLVHPWIFERVEIRVKVFPPIRIRVIKLVLRRSWTTASSADAPERKIKKEGKKKDKKKERKIGRKKERKKEKDEREKDERRKEKNERRKEKIKKKRKDDQKRKGKKRGDCFR